MIKINQINKYFNKNKGNQIHVIKDTTLTFPEKGLVVLLGSSGSGKTTLLNVIGGLDSVNSGTFDFNGVEIKKYKSKTWDKLRNEKIGYIFQNYNLMPQLSVYDNIALVLRMLGINDQQIINNYVTYVLNAVNMYPFRYKKALQLSGGQQQRVAIARALVKNPNVIIADEPTGNLDSKNTIETMNIIKAISREKLVILVTHEKDLAEYYGDRIIEIKDGSVVNDSENTASEGTIGADDTIYLKDLHKLGEYNIGNKKIDIYDDDKETKEDVDVKLIIKNNVLYLDIKSSFKNIQIVDDNSNIQIKDEHFKAKTREETTKTKFDTEFLDIKNTPKTKKGLFTFKNALKQAFINQLGGKKRRNFMFVSFLISGMMIALASSLFFGLINVDYSNHQTLSDDYVVLTSNKKLSYQEVRDLMSESDSMNLYGDVSLNLQLPSSVFGNFDSYPTLITKRIDVIDNLTDRDLFIGRLPQNNNEIVISYNYAQQLVGDTTTSSLGQTANTYGIWTMEELLSEKYVFGNATYTSIQRTIRVVGITHSHKTGMFLTAEMAKEITMPGVNPPEELIEAALFDRYVPNKEDNYKFDYFILSNDKAALSNKVAQKEGLVLKSAIDYYKDMVTQTSGTEVLLIVSIILAVVAALGFYFIIRSSMISRIYEISIYRALGVSKFDIAKSFIVEIIFITTVSTLIGFIIMYIGLDRLSTSIIAMFGMFNISFYSILTGLVLLYGINILMGMLPLIFLLRKTPSQIISRYDI